MARLKLFGGKTPNDSRVAGTPFRQRVIAVFSNKKVLVASLAVCIVAFLCALGSLGHILYTHLNQQQINVQINDMFETASRQAESLRPTPAPRAIARANEPAESEWERERRELLEAEARGRIIFADILEINPDFRGMIEVPGLMERQPYVMTGDNEKYLDTDFNGNRSANGTVFLSTFNDRLLMDNNSIFFGHYVNTGAMFTKLMDYKNAATFAKAPVIILDGLIGESVWVVFAAHVVEPDPWWMIPYNDEDEYAAHLEAILARSLFITDVDVDAGDRIITLALCDYTYEDMRFVVHARRLRAGEDIPESVTATVNNDRTDFVIPHQNRLSDIDMSGAAISVSSATNRHFFFKPVSGGIERYSGNRQTVQGPFRAVDHSGISENTNIASEVVRARDDANSRAMYVAAQGLGGRQGISVFTAIGATGTLTNAGVVTGGLDARYPAVQNIGNTVWLYFSVPAAGGSSDIFRQHALGGGLEYMHTAAGVPDARPLGLFTVHGYPVVLWYELSSGNISGARVGFDEVFRVGNAGANTRVTLHGTLSGTQVSAVFESGGRLTFTAIDLANAPTTPEEIPAATPDSSTTPDSGTAADDKQSTPEPEATPDIGDTPDSDAPPAPGDEPDG